MCPVQVMQMIWFTMIVRVAWKVVTGEGATDVRSDEEGYEPSCVLHHMRIILTDIMILCREDDDDSDDIKNKEE